MVTKHMGSEMSKLKRDAKRQATWQPRINRRGRRNAARIVACWLSACAAKFEGYDAEGLARYSNVDLS